MDYGSLDEQVARLHPEIKDAAQRFVLLKLGNMRGLDLAIFDFDYDLTWIALFLDADGHVLGRFGGRDADTPGKYHSLRGLRYSLEQAWQRFQRSAASKLPRPGLPAKRSEDYAAARRLSSTACIHCHNVNEFRREEKQNAGTWSQDEVWVYPEPAALGLAMAVDQGNRVRAVQPKSAAAKTGLRADDVLRFVHGLPTASVADVQYALHHAPASGAIPIVWQRGGQQMRGDVTLAAGWRKSDISWRWSLKTLAPSPQLHGEDLTLQEKTALGLTPRQLAFRQGSFVPTPARQAGIRINDIILGVDDKRLEMTARQFETYMRLNYKVGDVARYNILRGGERLMIAVKLPG
jgi:serine protease Do